MFSARIKLFGKHFNIFCLFKSILIVFSILVIIWNAEYRSPIGRFVSNWFLSRRAYNFPGRSTQDYSLEQADDYKHLSSMDDLETIFTLKFRLQKNKTVTCHSPFKQEVEFALCFRIQTNKAFFRSSKNMSSIAFPSFITTARTWSRCYRTSESRRMALFV